MRYGQTKELLAFKKELKKQVIVSMIACCDKFQEIAFDSQDEEYMLFKSYITSESIISILNLEYQKDKEKDFNFLKNFDG